MKHKFINIKVNCPRDICCTQTMQIHCIDPDDKGFFALAVNGCNYADMSESCKKCRAAIDKRFAEDLFYHPTEIIRPDFSKLK